MNRIIKTIYFIRESGHFFDEDGAEVHVKKIYDLVVTNPGDMTWYDYDVAVKDVNAQIKQWIKITEKNKNAR